MQVIVHPECRWEVCQKADALGSTERMIELIEKAPEGSSFAVGTEIHLVNRLAKQFAPLGKRVMTLDDTGCLCTTMYRISPAAPGVGAGKPGRRAGGQSHQGRGGCEALGQVALDRMLEIGVPAPKVRPAEAPAPEAAQRSA